MNLRRFGMLLLLASAGCSGRAQNSDGGSDSTGGVDAGVVACQQSLAAYCGDGGCPMTWQDALAGACPNPNQPADHDAISRCGAENVYGVFGTDTGTEYVFASDGGALLAVVFSGVGGSGCAGGPSSFALPQCLTFADPCADGGPGAGG